MRLRFAIGALLVCAAAWGQTLTVDKLEQFLRSAAQRKDPDKDIAGYLAHAHMSEKLDDRTIQQLQADGVVQPRTLHALWALRDASASLPAPKPGTVHAVTTAPIIPPSNEEQGRIIQDVREYALNYSQNLPDFICAEEVKRYESPRAHKGDNPAWRLGDTLLIKLSYFKQKEDYKLNTINFKPTDLDYEKVGGAKEFGSFGTLMRGIFEPASQAQFEYDHTSQLADRGVVLAFRYSIDLEHSNYELVWENSRRIRTAYSGMVLVSRDTHQVMRVTVEAQNIPADFPIKAAKTQLDYDWSELSGQKFLLPSTAQVIMAGDDRLTKNDERFVVYRKYSADAEIKFDTEPLPPENPDKNKEIKK
ncbi:MAG TPA: hypothetical protein VKB88_40860 [Bryobacteraceae bacterium]|nr:hypothetical protein [Bryobacteraceae bacterium]